MKVESLTPLLNVEDVARAIRFYRESLGFEVVAQAEDAGRLIWARVSAGDTAVMLNEHPGDADERRSRPAFTGTVLYVSVDDADSVYAHLHAQGVETGEIFDAAYGMREFHLRDTDGYEISITSRRSIA